MMRLLRHLRKNARSSDSTTVLQVKLTYDENVAKKAKHKSNKTNVQNVQPCIAHSRSNTQEPSMQM